MSAVIPRSSNCSPTDAPRPTRTDGESLRDSLSDAEGDFYQGYSWCLNLYPTVRQTIMYLRRELDMLKQVREDWQVSEILTNVFLLSCALLNVLDEYLRGRAFQLPKKAPAVPLYRYVRRTLETLERVLRMPWRRRVRSWRENWRVALDAFLAIFVAKGSRDAAALSEAIENLAQLLLSPLPADLQREHIFFPSAFRKHDLTHFDVLALGQRFTARFSDRSQPILLIGLRTAGSYFAPLLHAFLRTEGYSSVDVVTVRPEKGPGAAERVELMRCAREGRLAVIVDDSPRTGDAIVQAVDMVRKAGYPSARVVVLVPVHPATHDWDKHPASLSLSDTTILTLQAEEWHKVALLEPNATEDLLGDYFKAQQFASARVVVSPAAEQFNAQLHTASEDPRRARLKRVYEVQLRTLDGEEETRFVLAKSVGWGWLGYHALLVGHRLVDRVPPILGLRDGILYSEWLPQTSPAEPTRDDREQWIATMASYVARRVRFLRLSEDPTPRLGLHPHHDGIRLLDRTLSRAYGSFLAASMMRPSLRRRLAQELCPVPTLVDGKMECSEWVAGSSGLLKTDFEHHGMGKNELNVVDPAYDLAEAILRLSLSPEKEDRLLRRYVEESGDADVAKRLFTNKLLAGTWAATSALKALFRAPLLLEHQQKFHHHFLDAWHFLTVHAARFCGQHCPAGEAPCWRGPLMVLDIDGVLDRRIFGFPCTSAAGIEALALLHAHSFAIAVNTARSAVEVREYCRAYGFVGGAAEYGSYAWDAVNNCGHVLVNAESLAQLDALRRALRRLPGVFLDERYQYSIRAWTYEDRPSGRRSFFTTSFGSLQDSPYDGKYLRPLPILTVRHLLAEERCDRLRVHQTGIDTTIVAAEVDKGSGLKGLVDLCAQGDIETIAVGDSEPDLPMFRAADRSFAPSHIGCARLARSIGCRIVGQPYQRGLLRIVRSLIHEGARDCGRCPPRGRSWPRGQDLFLDLLEVADWKRSSGLLRALFAPGAYRAFMQ